MAVKATVVQPTSASIVPTAPVRSVRASVHPVITVMKAHSVPRDSAQDSQADSPVPIVRASSRATISPVSSETTMAPAAMVSPVAISPASKVAITMRANISPDPTGNHVSPVLMYLHGNVVITKRVAISKAVTVRVVTVRVVIVRAATNRVAISPVPMVSHDPTSVLTLPTMTPMQNTA